MNNPNPNPISGPPPFINGRYRLVRQLGKGSMGLVFRAQDELLKRNVSIKFLASDQIINTKRFLREARVVAGLSHPHIMGLYDAGQEDGWHYLVLEFIAGHNLVVELQSAGGSLSPKNTLHIMYQILESLIYAHQKGIIHRDIKPANIMITTDGNIKVTDFGLAISTNETRLTTDNVLMGTPLYLAPECIQGQSADVRSDLYSLGVVWYELLVGKTPYQGESTVTTLIEILNTAVSPPSEYLPQLSPQIESIILTLMEKDPAKRFASAQDVLAALPSSQSVTNATETAVTPPLSPTFIEQLAKTSDAIQQEVVTQLWAQTAAADTAVALESERKRLASQLQSHILEPINLLLGQAQLYEQTLSNQPQAKMVASVLATLARQLQQQVRDLEVNLHPTLLESLGLHSALESFTNQIQRTHGVTVTLKLAQLENRLATSVELALYRSTQTVVDAAITHGRATHITIQLQVEAHEIRYIIHDNRIAKVDDLPHLLKNQLAQLGGHLKTTQQLREHTLAIHFPIRQAIQLTPRETEVLHCLADGLTNKEIALNLNIKPRTVNFHLDNLYTKLGVNSRTEAVVYALRQGLFK